MTETDHRTVWRDRKLAKGLCRNCGKRPVGLNQWTKQPASRCDVCLKQHKAADQRRRHRQDQQAA